MRYLRVLGIALIAMVLAAATVTSQHKSAAAPRAQAAMSDAALEKAVQAKLNAGKISKDHFRVHVQGGVATLEGNTDVLQHKGTATRLAKNAGATKVVNHIVVSQAAKDKAASNLEQGRRRAQVKRSDTTSRGDKRSL